MGEEGIHLSASQWLHTLSKRDLELPKFSQGLNHVLWLRKSRDCLPMAWNTYSWLKLKCSGILQLHGRETNSTSKHELFCAAFTHPFQMTRVCQLLCAYICNFLASTWVCILQHVFYMLLPDTDWGLSSATGDLCCSRRAEHLPAPQSCLQRRQVIAQHRAFSSGWLCFLERIVGHVCGGDSAESWVWSLLQLSSLWCWKQVCVTFLSWVNYAAACNTYVLCRTRAVSLPCFLSLIYFLQ